MVLFFRLSRRQDLSGQGSGVGSHRQSGDSGLIFCFESKEAILLIIVRLVKEDLLEIEAILLFNLIA